MGVEESSGEPRRERFGRYVLLDRIGQGGMGVVYRAFDPRLKRHVALKLLLPERSSQSLRLIREAQLMAKVSDPSVVQVYDAGLEDGKVFIAMELIDGTTLARWLRSEPRSWNEILDAFLAAGRGLATAHASNLIHRDFKPSNVLVSKSGRVLVSDFGIATPIERSHASAGHSVVEAYDSVENEGALHTITLTQSGQGTPRYMAPEQREGRTAEPRADQYSFCVALSEALRDGGAPDEVLACLRQGLSHNRAGRFATMNELLKALRLARLPEVRQPRRSKSWLWASASAASIALIALIGIASDGSAAPTTHEAADQTDVIAATKATKAPPAPRAETLKPTSATPTRAPTRAAAAPVTASTQLPTHTTARLLPVVSNPRATKRRASKATKRKRGRGKSVDAPKNKVPESTRAVPDELIRDLWASE